MLYIMRHGTTDWNVEKRMQGRTDIPLNEEGRALAREAKEKYSDAHFDICFCSPLVRARETAELFLEGRDIDIVIDDRLVEMSFGIYEGVDSPAKIPGSPIRTFFKEPENYTGVEGGETFEELFERTGEFLEEKVEPLLSEGKDVLIVGHGAMNSAIISRIKGFERKDFWTVGIENCKLLKLI